MSIQLPLFFVLFTFNNKCIIVKLGLDTRLRLTFAFSTVFFFSSAHEQ